MRASEAPPQTDEESRRGDACRRPCRRTHGVGLPRRATTRVAPTRQLPAVECQNPTALQMQPACRHQRRSRNLVRLVCEPFKSASTSVQNATQVATSGGLKDSSEASPQSRGRPQGSPLREPTSDRDLEACAAARPTAGAFSTGDKNLAQTVRMAASQRTIVYPCSLTAIRHCGHTSVPVAARWADTPRSQRHHPRPDTTCQQGKPRCPNSARSTSPTTS